MIVPVYKPIGASTHLLAQKYGQQNNTKATHTGTLDPMASGVVVILTDQNRFEKTKYSQWKKTYTFDVVFGFSTDSHDPLGKIIAKATKAELELLENHPSVFREKIQNWLQKQVGQTSQLIPDFSARRVAGKSAFDFAKQGIKIAEESEKITIFDAKLLDFKSVETKRFIKTTIDQIAKVQGNFRQAEIIEQWQDIANQATNQLHHLYFASIEVSTSKRTYVRGLVRDMSQNLSFPAMANNITRTANGPYQIKDCICLL